MPRPITNRSNYWSDHHYGLLIMLAGQVLSEVDIWLDINELINVGWFEAARYYKDVRYKARWIKRKMFQFALKEKSLMSNLF